MKTLLADMSRAIVDYPDDIVIDEDLEGDTIVFTLTVAESDMGKIIGRHGKNARSIRTVMKAAANLVGKKVIVDIAE
ncbi:MAG: KH domain-containing protein [Clostridia bacterium]|nr:KH domain-containing protein [Clostridia bacterium]